MNTHTMTTTGIFMLLTLLLFPIAPNTCAQDGDAPLTAQEQAWLKNHPVIRVAPIPGYPPYHFFDDSGKFSGLAADFFEVIQEDLGVTIEVVVGTSQKEILEMLSNKEIDVIPSLSRQPEREKYMLFSDGYLRSSYAIITRRGDPTIQSEADLSGKRVVLLNKFAANSELFRRHPGLNYSYVDTPLEALLQVSEDKADATVFLYAASAYLISRNVLSDLEIKSVLQWGGSKGCVGVRKDWPEFVSILNKELKTIPEDKKIEIFNKWVYLDSGGQKTQQVVLTEKEKAWLAQNHVVRARVRYWPPFMFEDPEPSGMAVDYLKLAAQRAGFEVRFIPDTLGWPESVRDLMEERNHYDLILTMKRTQERAEKIALTDDYLLFPWVIIARDNSGFIGGMNDLNGSRVAVERGHVMQNKLQAEYPKINLFETETSLAAMQAVADGRAFAYIGNLANASYLIEEHGLHNLRIAAPTTFEGHDQAMGVRKDWPELLSIINKAIATMAPEDHNAIRNRWLGVRYEFGLQPREVMLWIGAILMVVLLIIGPTLYWNRRLATEVAVRQRTEKALYTAKEAAEAANQAKSVFLSNMSHELRTPLNTVLGFSQLMGADEGLNVQQKANLEIINRSGHHLLQLINDVLDMSKIEAGKSQLEVEDIDLGALIRDVVDMMRLRAEQKGLQLLLDQTSDFPRFVCADGPKLRQILINLMGNAIKYTNDGGVALRLGVTLTDDSRMRLACEVKDSGIGIAEEDLERIFKPFAQAGEQTDTKGTGLGLAITRQYVELMGGELTVESEVGKGSVFRFEIPVERVAAEEIEEAEPSRGRAIGLEPGQASWRILIVEDQLENRLLLRKLLEGVGFEVHEAVNGQEAIQVFEAWQPHLIWMDWRMPVMDGLTATRRIRAVEGGKETIIVALTASVFKEQRDEALESGCDDFLHKPFREAEIFDMMAKHLKARYIYTEQQPTTTAEPTGMDLPSSEAMAALPSEWLAVLAKAAEEIDLKAMEQIISRINERDKALAESLAYLVKDFRFDTLQDLVKEAMK